MLNRRQFLQALALLAAELQLGMHATKGMAATALSSNALQLEKLFAAPPGEARPWVYWFWVNGNVSREGITADLEAMHRVGIGGVLIFTDVGPGTPAGPASFAGPVWYEMFDFAVAEAIRLGLLINLHNAAGWAGSAGAWITPELSMQKVVWSETLVTSSGHEVELSLQQPDSFEGYYRDISVMAFPIPESDKYRIPDIEFKAGYKTMVRDRLPEQGIPLLPIAPAPVQPEFCVDTEHVLDLSQHFHDGKLVWKPPTGRWLVVRFGHTSTGKGNHPVTDAGLGLECDKFSKNAVGIHFQNFVGRIAKRYSGSGKTPLVATHIDSWEAGAQNWSADFPAEFHARRGYDPRPYLPIMTGRVIGSSDVSERFLWDLRQTISDLVIENYAGEMRHLANASGLRLSIEAYDADPTDQIQYGGQADEPQAEFWYGRDFFPEVHRSWAWAIAMRSAAHIYGKPVVAAESFTSMPGEDWQAHPALLKPLGDWALCEGINRIVFHRYAMQPWTNRSPGMTMGPWGVHYDRTQTWWEDSKPWHEYLDRCQTLLRQGHYVADLLYLTPEGAPMRIAAPGADARSATPPATPGYNFDGCPADAVFTRLNVKDGHIVLPDGMQYRLLVLPESGGDMPGAGAMTPKLLERIAALVEQGMVLVGAPPTQSPSLADYPHADGRVREIAKRLWGDCDGTTVKENRVGSGRVIWGRSPQQVMAQMGVPPDFTSGSDEPFRYVHRRLEDGTDIYFVANKQAQDTLATCAFRVPGRRPELWDAETGHIQHPAQYEHSDAGISMPLHLGPNGSIFVTFRAQASIEPDRVASVLRDGQPSDEVRVDRTNDAGFRAEISRPGRYELRCANGNKLQAEVKTLPTAVVVNGPWTVRFSPGMGAPAELTFKELVSWSDHPDPGVRYFSGRANYTKVLKIDPALLTGNRRILLDLGQVEVIARVKVNGKELGVSWKPPYVADITDVAHAGSNQLEISVVNLWPNRIIGDAQLPEDTEWNPGAFGNLKGFGEFGESVAKWPQWLLDGKPSPTGRFTFATWKVWKKDSPLLKSGLLGPVKLSVTERVRFEPHA